MRKQTKRNVKGVFASTVAATMILSNGIPMLQVEASELPTVPTLPSLSAPVSEVVKGEYVVTFKEGTPVETMKADIEQYGGVIVEANYDSLLVTIRLSPEEFENMKQDSDVAIIEENITFGLLGYGPLEQYSHDKTQVSKAWESNLKGSGIDIAVLDTGISPHSDLNIVGGTSTVNYTSSYADDSAHGTHVAGIIASKDNGEGTTGVASEANIYAVKVLNSQGKGELMDIIEGVEWAIDKGVDIINISLGTYSNSQTFKNAIDRANEQGIMVVAATGNTGDTRVMYPAKYDNVVAVGATDRNNNIASFSTRGSEVDIVAPGAGIISTYLGNRYANGNGTSQAAPYVSGMLALLKEQYPNKSSNEIIQMLYDNALDLGAEGKDSVYGYGLVQFPATTENVKEEPITEEVTEEPIVEEEKTEEEPIMEEETPVTEVEPAVEEETPTVEEEPVTEEKPVVEEEEPVKTPSIKEHPSSTEPSESTEQKIELNGVSLSLDTETSSLSWGQFENASRYRVKMEQKQANGSYKAFSYIRSVSKTEFDLDVLKEGYEYKLNLIPLTGGKYDEDLEIEVYISTKNGLTMIDKNGNAIQSSINPEQEKSANQEQETTVPEQKEIELPEGFTFDSESNTLAWEQISGTNKYRVKMEQKQWNGDYKSYSFARAITGTEFGLDLLDKGYEYKLTVIPRIGWQYKNDLAVELYVSTKNGVIVAGDPEALVNEETDSQEKEKIELPTGFTYEGDSNSLLWETFAGAKYYRVKMEEKQANGTYKDYSYQRTVLKKEFELDVLKSGKEYKLTIIPRVGSKYDETKAVEVLISTK